ncbi:hypothetical protein ScPMuIL_003114 [Solemya velum]
MPRTPTVRRAFKKREHQRMVSDILDEHNAKLAKLSSQTAGPSVMSTQTIVSSKTKSQSCQTPKPPRKRYRSVAIQVTKKKVFKDQSV